VTPLEALARLQDVLATVEPGPARHAYAYVCGLIGRGELGAELERQSPMLVGALLVLLRHVRRDPGAYLAPVGEDWACYTNPRAGEVAYIFEASTELEAVTAALVAEAGRLEGPLGCSGASDG
jgi:hypothetical protein